MSDLKPGDRVVLDKLGAREHHGKVIETNENDAYVNWDDDLKRWYHFYELRTEPDDE